MKSYTLELIEEAFEKVQEYYHYRYIDDLKNLNMKFKKKNLPFNLQYRINNILNKIELHLTYKSKFERLQSFYGESMGKWSAIGTLFLALNNPRLFDKVRDILSDKESKEVFDWVLKFRIAYSFLGEVAEEIYPPKVTKEEFVNKKNSLKNIKGYFKLDNFIIDSDPTEILGSWIFEQYCLKEKVEVTNGDFVIDGGSYKGETSFWFLYKGAAKIFAFEPDPYNFKILCENISRNKVKERIIPIQKILSNTNLSTTLFVTGSGGSSIYDKANFTCQSITIERFIKDENIEKVDFIKLDVEGSEIMVLEGATNTIKKFNPKLAISVYHRPDDLINIINFLYNLLPKAKFYLDHKSYNVCETILYVNPRS